MPWASASRICMAGERELWMSMPISPVRMVFEPSPRTSSPEVTAPSPTCATSPIFGLSRPRYLRRRRPINPPLTQYEPFRTQNVNDEIGIDRSCPAAATSCRNEGRDMTKRFVFAAMVLLPAVAMAAPTGQSMGAKIADVTDVGTVVPAAGPDSFAGVKVDFPDGVTGYPDITYQTLPGYRPLKLDLFLPPKTFAPAGPRPLIVYVQGGGWLAGGPRRSAAYTDWPKVLASLAARGYVVASVSYRFSSEA